MNNAEQLLALPEPELIRIASEKFVPKPWKHNITGPGRRYCHKCEMYGCTGPCPVPDPDPIKLDGNTAMALRDKAVAGKDSTAFSNYLLEVFGGGIEGDIDECFAKAQPRHYIIAAILAEGDSK